MSQVNNVSPVVSIIVPIYNTEKYLRRCLNSIQNQTVKDFEVLLIDDCGTDKAIEIAAEYCVGDNRFRIIKHRHNMGPMVVRETGYKSATGSYLMFVDSDDYLYPNAIETLLSGFNTENDIDIVIGCMTFLNEKEGDNNRRQYLESAILNPSQTIERILDNKLTHSMCAKIFRKQLFNNDLLCFEGQTNGEDAMLWYQLIVRAKYVNIINEPVYIYYLNNASSSRSAFTYSKLHQLVIAQNFVYEILSQLDINCHLIEAKVVRSLFLFIRFYPNRGLLRELNPEIIRIGNRAADKHLGYIRGCWLRVMIKFHFVRRLMSILNQCKISYEDSNTQ